MDDFSVLAVECCVVQKLPGLFSPEVVYLLDDETVRRIAAEDEAAAAERARLADMLSVLEAGLEDLRQRAGYQSGMHGARLSLHVQPVTGSPPARASHSTHREENHISNGSTPSETEEPTPDSPVVEAQSPLLPPSPPRQAADEPATFKEIWGTAKTSKTNKKGEMANVN